MHQTYDNVEHLIIDGKSTDGTLDIAEQYRGKYAQKGKKLTILSEPDQGLYDAMNKGIARATGDVVGLLNSDDWYTADTVLETIAGSMENVDAVYGDIHFVENGNERKTVRKYSSKNFRPWTMLAGYMPAHPSFYCRRRVYKTFGLFDTSFRIGADFEQLFRLIYLAGIKTTYLPVDMVTMRTGGVSTSGLRSHIRILKDHYKCYAKHGRKWAIGFDILRYPQKLFALWIFRLKRLGRED